jgi:hypothetical protein
MNLDGPFQFSLGNGACLTLGDQIQKVEKLREADRGGF